MTVEKQQDSATPKGAASVLTEMLGRVREWWNEPASEVDKLCELAERCGALEERHACAKLVRDKAHSIGAKADDADDRDEEIRLKALAWQMEVMACEIEKRSNDQGQGDGERSSSISPATRG